MITIHNVNPLKEKIMETRKQFNIRLLPYEIEGLKTMAARQNTTVSSLIKESIWRDYGMVLRGERDRMLARVKRDG